MTAALLAFAPAYAASPSPSPLEAARALRVPAVQGAPVVQTSAQNSRWTNGSFDSPVDGSAIRYKRLAAPAGSRGPSRIFVGGLALAGFDSLFMTQRPPAADQYFMSLRGHPPSAWSRVQSPLDSDARELARMITVAARTAGNGRIELVLHSFGAMIVQRLAQMREDDAFPETRDALRLLRGGRLVLLNATTHFEGSERMAGREFEQMGKATRAFVDWLDVMDASASMMRRIAETRAGDSPQVRLLVAQMREQRRQAAEWIRRTDAYYEAWGRLAEMNPFLAPQARAFLAMWRSQRDEALAWIARVDAATDEWERSAEMNPVLAAQLRAALAAWSVQRDAALALGAKQAAELMRKDLQEAWDPAIDSVRRGYLRDLDKNAKDPGWQEALLRRTSDMFRLEFTRADAEHLLGLGLEIVLVYATKDKLLNWESGKALFELLGLRAPAAMPPAGTVLRDPSGRVRAHIVEGDHYFPWKNPSGLSRILDP